MSARCDRHPYPVRAPHDVRSRRRSLVVLAAITALAVYGDARLARAQPAAATPSQPAATAPAEPAAATPAEAAPPPPPTMQPVDPGAPRLPSRVDDGSRIRLPPIVVAQDPPAVDRRPIYLGAGLIVLAAVFWWNRRRRDRFEREDHGTAPARPARSRDADADDLHAAARGDGPEPPGPDAEPERSDPP